jgi:hypothetical protein
MSLNRDENGVEFLKSASMIEITASQNGNELKPNPDSQINVGIASNRKDAYPLYEFEKGAGWKTIGDTRTINQKEIDSISNSTIPELPKFKREDYTLYEVTKGLIEDKPNLAKFEGMSFQAINNENNRPIPNFLKDMDISALGNGKYKFTITEHTYGKDPYTVLCHRVYNKKEFAEKAKIYNDKYGEYIRIRNAILLAQKTMIRQGNTVLRSFSLSNFGILNCDQADRQEYDDFSFSVNGEKQPNIVLYCIDYTRNAKYVCTRVDKIGVQSKNEFAIFGINENQEVLYSPVSDCEKALKGKHFDFNLKKLDGEKSIEEIGAFLRP